MLKVAFVQIRIIVHAQECHSAAVNWQHQHASVCPAADQQPGCDAGLCASRRWLPDYWQERLVSRHPTKAPAHAASCFLPTLPHKAGTSYSMAKAAEGCLKSDACLLTTSILAGSSLLAGQGLCLGLLVSCCAVPTASADTCAHRPAVPGLYHDVQLISLLVQASLQLPA